MNVDVNKETDSSAGYAYIEQGDIEEARLILACVTEKYDHLKREILPSVGTYDKEAPLNEMVELQERMATGMLWIKRVNKALKTEWKDNPYMGAIYWAWSDKPDKQISEIQYMRLIASGDLRKEMQDKINEIERKQWNLLTHPNNRPALDMLNTKKLYWDTWNGIKDDCSVLAKAHPSVWPKYFQLRDGEEDTKYDPRAHKKDSLDLDNRMLTSDEAFFEGHMEEQEELFSYNRV